MPPVSQDIVISLLLQKSVLDTMLSNAKYQKAGVPNTLIKSIISIITTDKPKTYLLWGSSIKEKQFLYAVYNTVFFNTPELNNFISSTLLEEKRKYGLKAARELEYNIPPNASTTELTQYLAKVVTELGTHQSGPPTHW